MQVLDLKQGSPQWIAARANYFTASEAPAMMGLSKYQTRTALLAQKKSGIAEDIAPATQALFDRGHAAEASARNIAETMICEELYPCTGAAEIEGLPLLASFDGLSMSEEVSWEHKLYNAGLADYIIEHNDLPETHYPQVEQQMLVSGAARALFMVSDGTENNFAHIWYESKPERRAALIAGWKQFAADLAEFVPHAVAPQVIAAPVESLPAVFVQVTGSLAVTDNLMKFEAALQSFIGRINTKPQTDQDFADCESAIKTLSKAEEALDAAESAALAQVECIDTMRMLKATLKDLARNNRLSLEKLVKAEKENRRILLVMDAQRKLQKFISEQNHADLMPIVTGDFAGVIKGLKSLDSMADKINTELARATIDASSWHNRIARNVTAIDSLPEFAALFADRRALVIKDEDFVLLTVKQRITDHQAAELAKEEALREKIKAEELARVFPEDAITEKAAAVAVPCSAVAAAPQNIAPAVVALNAEGSMTLGAINARLAPISLTREGLASLGFAHIGRDKAAYLFRESDFPRVCAALIDHIGRAANGLKVAV